MYTVASLLVLRCVVKIGKVVVGKCYIFVASPRVGLLKGWWGQTKEMVFTNSKLLTSRR